MHLFQAAGFFPSSGSTLLCPEPDFLCKSPVSFVPISTPSLPTNCTTGLWPGQKKFYRMTTSINEKYVCLFFFFYVFFACVPVFVWCAASDLAGHLLKETSHPFGSLRRDEGSGSFCARPMQSQHCSWSQQPKRSSPRSLSEDKEEEE